MISNDKCLVRAVNAVSDKKSIVFVSLCWCTVNVFMYSMLLDVQKLHVNRWSGLFLLMPVNLLLKINENWRHHLFAASTPSTLSLKAPQNPQTLFVAASRSPCQKEAVSELCLHVVILVTSNMRTWFFSPLLSLDKLSFHNVLWLVFNSFSRCNSQKTLHLEITEFLRRNGYIYFLLNKKLTAGYLSLLFFLFFIFWRTYKLQFLEGRARVCVCACYCHCNLVLKLLNQNLSLNAELQEAQMRRKVRDSERKWKTGDLNRGGGKQEAHFLKIFRF